MYSTCTYRVVHCPECVQQVGVESYLERVSTVSTVLITCVLLYSVLGWKMLKLESKWKGRRKLKSKGYVFTIFTYVHFYSFEICFNVMECFLFWILITWFVVVDNKQENQKQNRQQKNQRRRVDITGGMYSTCICIYYECMCVCVRACVRVCVLVYIPVTPVFLLSSLCQMMTRKVYWTTS